jgi:hypothetical protein
MKPLFLIVVPGGQEAYRQSCTGTANHWHAFAALPDPHLTLALVLVTQALALYTSTSLGPAANQLSCLVFFLLNLSS